MRFDRDEQAGITIKNNIISHAVFIVIDLLLCVKVLLEPVPRTIVAIALACGSLYMLLRMLRFIRFYNMWKNAYIEIGDDRAKGYAADKNLRKAQYFDIPAGEVNKIEFTTVSMTRNTPLNALQLTSESKTYVIVGIVADEQTKRVFQLDD